MPGDFRNNRSYGRNNFGGPRQSGSDRAPPVKVGDEIDVKIESVGEKGDGVAKKDGFVIFIPGVKEGDEVRIRITNVLRKAGFAEHIGAAQSPVQPAAPKRTVSAAEEKAREIREVAMKATQMEDSEDFGEEPSEEDPATEEPIQEDPAEEEPSVEEELITEDITRQEEPEGEDKTPPDDPKDGVPAASEAVDPIPTVSAQDAPNEEEMGAEEEAPAQDKVSEEQPTPSKEPVIEAPSEPVAVEEPAEEEKDASEQPPQPPGSEEQTTQPAEEKNMAPILDEDEEPKQQ